MMRTDFDGVATDTLEKSEQIGAAYNSFLKNGYAILDHVVPEVTVRALADEFDARYARYLDDREADDSLNVGPRRYMVPVGLSGGFGDPLIFANPYVLALVRQLLDKDAILEAFGAVVSLSGAAKQHIHRDGPPLFSAELSTMLPPFALTFALPLIGMDETRGTTALWPGSHRWVKRNEDVPPEIPTVPVGSCLVWDFRLFHGGTENRSDRHRPMIYATYARRWYQDPKNFKKETQPRLVFEPDFLSGISEDTRALLAHVRGAERRQ